jgi:hypothetical protein
MKTEYQIVNYRHTVLTFIRSIKIVEEGGRVIALEPRYCFKKTC